MSQSTVLLDLDGTLLDSATGITEHLSAAIVSVGAGLPLPETLRACVGPPFEVVMPTLGLRPDQVQAAITEYRRTYDPVASALSVPYPGIIALLDRLVDHGIALAVATSKPESLARDIVTDNGLAGYFEVIGGADLAIGRTGKAAVVGSVLDRLAMSNSAEMVMVGDRLHDVHGAAALGLATIGVSWGYAEPGELLDAGAIAVVDTPRELGDLLLQRLRRAA
ncbi:MAG: HAD hydrolase-like protein [Geodermatophilaceae bacterium]